MDLQLVSRKEWGARDRVRSSRLTSFDEGWIIHYLGPPFPAQMSDEQRLMSVQRYHMSNLGWSDIAYSFAVGRDGRIFALRGWGVAGGHTSYRGEKERTSYYNKNAHGVLFLVGEGEDVPAEMYEGLEGLLAYSDDYPRGEIRGHQEVESIATACPGPVMPYIRKFRKEPPMSKTLTKDAAESVVTQAYDHILRREEDEEGYNWWVQQLVEGERTVGDVRWHFYIIRQEIVAAKEGARFLAQSGNQYVVDTEHVEQIAEERVVSYLQELFAAAK